MAERDEENWLARWARRKAAAKSAEPKPSVSAEPPLSETPQPPPAESDAVTPSAEAASPPSAPAAVRIEDLPPIESLSYESDFTPFLNPEVPEGLRQQALRHLWRSNPLLANLDGLNDYDEDYTMVGKAEEVVDTLYRIGRGMTDPEAEQGPRAVEGRGGGAGNEEAVEGAVGTSVGEAGSAGPAGETGEPGAAADAAKKPEDGGSDVS